MIKTIPDINSVFTRLLQKNIVIRHRDKILREGHLVLFSMKDYVINVKLQLSAQKYVTVELLYPFSFKVSKAGVVLSYKIDEFIDGNVEIEHCMRLYFSKKLTKFYDSEIQILIK